MSDRKRKAAEMAMKRRRGASKHHAERVKAHMLAQPDLYTTCQECGQVVKGSLAEIQAHAGECHGD